MPYAALGDRLDEVRARIDEHQRKGGWSHRVRVVAVTKTHGPEAVRAAVAAGLTDVAENRVAEALAKQAACADVAVRWHLIGGLQRRKVRDVVGRFALIQSLDRLELADEILRRSGTAAPPAVLVQVNCSAEPQKGGVAPAALPGVLDALRDRPALRVEGLMTMAAADASRTELHRTFAQLRQLRDAAVAAGHAMAELSMGMSGDYDVAVEEGATMVRLGSALLGERAAPI